MITSLFALFFRCFPHVVNIAVQKILSNLDSNPSVSSAVYNAAKASLDSQDLLQKLQSYSDALKSRPIRKICSLVGAC